MFLIQEILVSSEVFNRKFVCNLSKCKGACCWEGDYGAPVASSEIEEIKESLDAVKTYLPIDNIDVINRIGPIVYDEKYKGNVTPLMKDGSCAYLFKNELGIATCSFEAAHKDGKSSFKKPISCHLYPIRIAKNEETDFEALNYDEWDICSDACQLGEELSVPVFRFLKDALIRQYGEEFYAELEGVYEQLIDKN